MKQLEVAGISALIGADSTGQPKWLQELSLKNRVLLFFGLLGVVGFSVFIGTRDERLPS